MTGARLRREHEKFAPKSCRGGPRSLRKLRELEKFGGRNRSLRLFVDSLDKLGEG